METTAARRGDRIRARRTHLGLTQVQLAEAVGVEQTTVSKWEVGSSRPRHDDISRIAKALKIKPATLFNWLTEPAPEPAPEAEVAS